MKEHEREHELERIIGYKFHNIYRGKGPVLTAISVEPAEKPQNDVVTFS